MRTCSSCGRQRERAEYSKNQWGRGAGRPSRCLACVAGTTGSKGGSDESVSSAITDVPRANDDDGTPLAPSSGCAHSPLFSRPSVPPSRSGGNTSNALTSPASARPAPPRSFSSSCVHSPCFVARPRRRRARKLSEGAEADLTDLTRQVVDDMIAFVKTPTAAESAGQCLRCSKAGGPTVALSRCGKCKTAQCCSRECQVADWASHTAACKVARAVAAKTEAAAKQEAKVISKVSPLPHGATCVTAPPARAISGNRHICRGLAPTSAPPPRGFQALFPASN